MIMGWTFADILKAYKKQAWVLRCWTVYWYLNLELFMHPPWVSYLETLRVTSDSSEWFRMKVETCQRDCESEQNQMWRNWTPALIGWKRSKVKLELRLLNWRSNYITWKYHKKKVPRSLAYTCFFMNDIWKPHFVKIFLWQNIVGGLKRTSLKEKTENT